VLAPEPKGVHDSLPSFAWERSRCTRPRQDTEKRFAEAQREQSDEISRQDIAEQQFLEAQRLVDAFRPGVAGQCLRAARVLVSRLDASVTRREPDAADRLPERREALAPAEWGSRKGLDAQREVLTWAPGRSSRGATATSATYFVGCTASRRRRGHFARVRIPTGHADYELPAQHEAFLHYHRARLLLFTGAPFLR